MASCYERVTRRCRLPGPDVGGGCFTCTSGSFSFLPVFNIVIVILVNNCVIVRDVFHVSVGSGVEDCKRLQAVNTAPGRVGQVMGQRKHGLNDVKVLVNAILNMYYNFLLFSGKFGTISCTIVISLALVDN